MYKHISLLALLLLILVSLPAQNQSHFLVSAEPFLNLRSEPDKYSEVLARVPDQSVIEGISDDFYDMDTVQGIPGSWTKVKFGEQLGWAFNAFLAPVTVPDTAPEWVVLDAHSPAYWGLVPFHEDLKWYTMHLSADSLITYFRPFTHRFTCEINNWEEPSLYLEWDEGPMPELLVATTRDLSPEPGAEIRRTRGMEIGFLYPYEEAGIGLESGLMIHFAGWIGEKGEETWSNQPYEVRYKIGRIGHENQSLFTLKNSGKLLKGGNQSAFYAAIYKLPAIIWAGDINEDGIPDLISRDASGYESCGYQEETVLYLGRKTGNDYELVKETGWK